VVDHSTYHSPTTTNEVLRSVWVVMDGKAIKRGVREDKDGGLLKMSGSVCPEPSADDFGTHTTIDLNV